MKTFRTLAVALLTAFTMITALTVTAAPANAQATRTWVSGVGDDVNPCSRTAPCKTFAGAISKTASTGEINCLDPGGFGALTITKSITVDCTGTFGSTLNSGGINGFVINDSLTATPGTVEVKLRGLSINGAGTTPGLNGIRFLSGHSLVVEDVFIQNQRSGSGVSIAPSAAPAEVYLHNVTISDSGNGVAIAPTGTGTVRATLNNVRVVNVSGNGLSASTASSTGAAGISALVRDSTFEGGLFGVLVSTGVGSPPSVALLKNASIFDNSGVGIRADGSSARVRVNDSSIIGNSTGVSSINSGAVQSYGNNELDFNGVDGTFSLPALTEE
jgi:hypothetical protein